MDDVEDSGRFSPFQLPFHVQIMEEDIDKEVHWIIKSDENSFLQSKTEESKRQALQIILILRRSYDHRAIKKALLELKSVFDDSDAQVFLVEQQVHHSVFSAMKHLDLHNDIQMIGCELIHLCIKESSDLCSAIIHTDIYRQVLKTVKNNPSDLELQICGMKIFSRLLQFEVMRDQLSLENETTDVADILFSAISNFQQSEDVLIFAFLAVHNLLLEDHELQKKFMEKEFEVLLETLILHQTNSRVTDKIFAILEVIAKNEDLRDVLVTENIHNIVLGKLDSMSNSTNVIQRCCRLLCIMCEVESVKESLCMMGFMKKKLVPLMLNNPTNAVIVTYGLKIFCQLALFTFSEKVKDDWDGLSVETQGASYKQEEVGYEWCKVIYLAMSKHLDSRDVQLWGCHAVSVLLECQPEACIWIRENISASTPTPDPLHTQCLGAILMFRKDPVVFTAACGAIYKLAADNGAVCTSLMQKNTHVAVLDGMALHLQTVGAVVAGCMAVHGLCIFHEEHKLALISQNTQSLLTKIMLHYPRCMEVQIEVISTLACLGDINLVRHQCFIDNVHVRIKELLETYIDNALLQEAGLECLGVLSAAEQGSDLLYSIGLVPCVVQTLSVHRSSVNIQKKGLILLQLLASPSMCHDPLLCDRMAQVVSQAFASHADESSVLKEACVAVQILSEGGNVISDSFVREGCHDALFTILKNNQFDSQLHDLASECLCVLGLEQILKSKMLLSMCNKGNIHAAECLLEMGADVNFGAGSETALCIAVEQNNEDLVRLLLKQHVTDLHTPLKKSLKNESHGITGLLLGCINKDRDSSTMSWSGLKLQTLHVDWFKMAYSNQMLTSTSDVSRHILSKIKRSEEKRAHRPLKQTMSDSKLDQRDNFRFKYETRRHHSEKSNMYQRGDRRYSLPTIQTEPDLRAATNLLKRHLKHQGKQKGQPLSPINSPQQSFNILTVSGTYPESPTKEHEEVFFKQDYSMEEDQESFTNSVFEMSYSDVEEWKSETLSGANVPFSPADPRRRSSVGSDSQIMTGPWKRKNRSPTPAVIKAFHLESSVESGYNRYTGHQLSVPYLPSDGDSSSNNTRKKRSSDPGIEMRDRLNSGDSLSSDQESTRSDPGKVEFLQPSIFDLSCNLLTSVKGLLLVAPLLQSSFQFLTKLFLNDNRLESLPDGLFMNLKELRSLDVGSNSLTEFPKSVLVCPKLKNLDLSHNKITSIGELKRNDSLQELILSHNCIEQFPLSISKYLVVLETLQLSRNQLQDLPNNSLSMTELKTLYLSYNKIKEIPEDFLYGCPKLEHLEASNNLLVRLPSEEVTFDLPRLTKLKLARNMLTEKEPFYIPKFILELQNLRSVDLCENGLIGLPSPSQWKSQMMKEIHVSRNNLTKINLEGAKVWSKLEAFYLSHNNLSELPKDIGQLTSLTSLDISHNKALTFLPDDLGRCSKMWEMPLHGVGFTLDRIHQGKVKDLITYLHNKLKKATRYFRMKLMVVGFGGRGKSTLLRALMKQYKKQNVDAPTVGVIVKNWRFERYRHFNDFHGNVTYIINTWDFAGQEEFYSTHQCYLSNRAVYLVVIDLRKGESELSLLKAWLSNIHVRAPGCPVIVVGTHADCLNENKRQYNRDLVKSRLRSMVLKLGLSDVHDFFAVDCTKETPEIEHLREFIKDKIDEYTVKGEPVMGRKVPADYVKLGEILENEARSPQMFYPVITHTQLLRIVEERGLDVHEEDLKQAVRFLHESGVVLHYEDSTLHLKDLYFIDPGWLCRMMAQVVTVRQINPFIKDGLLRKSDMKLLFTGKKVDGENMFTFPATLIPQYVKLLEKFEIALQHLDEKLLIPCHLPDKRPDLHVPVTKKCDKICRYYAMPLIPLGMWSRLISRLFIFSNSALTLTLIDERHSQQMNYWKKGIYVYWSNGAFFLLDSHEIDEEEEIRLTVPATKKGSTLLGLIVDHIDALIEEWFPGLTMIDPLQGKELLTTKVPCVYCKDDPDQKLFFIDQLLIQSEQNVEVYCDVHKGYVPLSRLAPDIVLNDLSSDLQLDHSQFEFKESRENLLGDGGYGAVYKGIYRGQAVAVKVIGSVATIHPHKLQRQEVTILRCLHHPSIVQLLGVSFHPRVIVLELAHKNSLGTMLKSGRVPLSRLLQQRIALQVAEGLAYLHKLMIVYRDMKPDNILMYSTETNDIINAKISDYGIARFTTFDGLMAQEGTPAYRAPEVIRGETYSFQADMFSYGITLYALLTEGRHPFDEFEFKSEMDRAVAEGLPIPPITRRGSHVWPDMEDILYSCLAQLPDQRPQAKDVADRLKSPEIFSLKKYELVSKATTLECFASRQDKNCLNLWFSSGNADYVEIAKINLLNPCLEPKGTYFPHGRILCLEPIDDRHLLVGSQMARIWLYDVVGQVFKPCTSVLPDAVLSLKFISGSSAESDIVFVGLANGMIAVLPVTDIMTESNINPMCLSPGSPSDPVRCMVVHSQRWLYASCGSKITIFGTRKSIYMQMIFDTLKQSKPPNPCIYTMVLGQSQLIVSHMGMSTVQIWDLSKIRGARITAPKLRQTISMSKMFGLSPRDARVTSITLQYDNCVVWVGMGGGYIGLVDLKAMKGLNLIHRYSRAIRGLLYINTGENSGSFRDSHTRSFSAVLSGGLGFKDRPGAVVDKEKEYGCLAVWDPDFEQVGRTLQTYLQARKDREDEMCKHH